MPKTERTRNGYRHLPEHLPTSTKAFGKYAGMRISVLPRPVRRRFLAWVKFPPLRAALQAEDDFDALARDQREGRQ